jgi:hypothetical protein
MKTINERRIGRNQKGSFLSLNLPGRSEKNCELRYPVQPVLLLNLQPITCILPVYYLILPYITCILPYIAVYYLILPVYYLYITCVLPVYYLILPVYYLYIICVLLATCFFTIKVLLGHRKRDKKKTCAFSKLLVCVCVCVCILCLALPQTLPDRPGCPPRLCFNG